jgi:sulfur carrier protein
VILTVNGERREVAEDATLADLLPGNRASDDRGVAIARNGEVVPRRVWRQQRLEAGDRVEILNAVGGG